MGKISGSNLRVGATVLAILAALWATASELALDYTKKKYATAADYDTAMLAVAQWMAEVSRAPWVFPVMWLLIGVAIGAWLDVLLRRLDARRLGRIKQLGQDMLNLGARMDNERGAPKMWPTNVALLSGRMMSVKASAEQLGVWAPGPSNLESGEAYIIGYYVTVGQLLADGHLTKAREASRHHKGLPA